MAATYCKTTTYIAALFCLLPLLIGCQKGPDPAEVAGHLQRVLLADEPEDLMGVTELREAFTGGDLLEESEETPATSPPEGTVAVVGRVGGLANPWSETQRDFPFVAGKAAFFLADAGAVAESEAAGHTHAPGEECPFCASHAADNSAFLAMVRFLDPDAPDQEIAIGADRLFEIKTNDTVVVRGEARLIGDAETGMLVIDADGLYVRSE